MEELGARPAVLADDRMVAYRGQEGGGAFRGGMQATIGMLKPYGVAATLQKCPTMARHRAERGSLRQTRWGATGTPTPVEIHARGLWGHMGRHATQHGLTKGPGYRTHHAR